MVLISHSLACAAICHRANKHARKIKGALLVSPSDVEAPKYTSQTETEGFSPIPLQKIPFKTVVVASADDPWVSLERAKFFADNWGSEFINIGNAGHINVASGYGEWQQGLDFLKKFE